METSNFYPFYGISETILLKLLTAHKHLCKNLTSPFLMEFLEYCLITNWCLLTNTCVKT